jgi:hypothetical protein
LLSRDEGQVTVSGVFAALDVAFQFWNENTAPGAT